MPSDFVHLHVHTEFSLLDGQSRIKDLINHAIDLEMPAVGISDHGVMFGVIDFFRAAKAADVKPVIGMEAYLAPRGMTDKDSVLDKKPFHMLLWAQNMTGYLNLMKMASAAQLEGYYYRPRIDRDFMAAHSEGIIATSGCLAAEIPRLVEDGREDLAREKVGWYLDVFGADNFYLELQPHKIDQLEIFNRWLVDYRQSHHTNVQVVATNDVHYVREDDWDVHDTLLCIQTGSLKGEEKRMRMSPHNSYYMKSAAEMRAEFSKHGMPDAMINEAFANSLKIAGMTDVELDTDEYHLPIFPVPPEFETEGAYLRYLCEMGLSWRFPGRENEKVLRERIDRELGIIGDMGFNTYFLIVWDLCEFARHADIWWNVRGSGAGSLVAYCMGITNIDPIQNSLLFERFLNPGRVSMPDVDLDYPDDRRGEMIAYAANKYGKDKVAAIITFGTMGAKASVKDVGRALGVDLAKINQATSLIPQDARQKKIAEYIEANPELQDLYNKDAEIKRVMDTAIRLQGMTRHASTHAAGVIIADKPLMQYTPLHRITGTDPSGGALESVTQFPMETAESIGLLKVDFLGLSTLTILRKACDLINKYHGTNYNMDNIPYRHDDLVYSLSDEDKQRLDEAFKMMGRGETVGVFQVESGGMQAMLRGMQPKKFEHIIAGISLYRPGPMDFIPAFNDRLHEKEEVPYKHPKLEPILKETYGIMVYQEQLMQIAGELFNYQLGEADLMRRAVSKKKQKDLLKHKAIFKERGPANGIPEDVAEAIFDEIEFFANYGFNKCVVGSTEIVDAATGRIVTIEDLYQKRADVAQTLTCDTNTLKLQDGAITDVMYNGHKPVFKLTTGTGRQIDATDNHPFYAFDGWRELQDLAVGMKIAVPRRIPVEGRATHANNLQAATQLSRAVLKDFIGAYIHNHGTISQETLVLITDSNNQARLLQHLLLRLAILSTTAQNAVYVAENELTRLEELVADNISQAMLHKSVRVPVVTTGAMWTDESQEDIFWDEIVSIEYIGEEPTYDLTIADTHNFIANDILVHNSHASDYAVLTVQTAFLKCHYTAEFMTALLCVQFDNSDKVATFLEECRRLQIPVLPPHVNNSVIDFDIEAMADGTRGIRFGMGAIKNAGVSALEHIISERETGGQFNGLAEFCRRVDLRAVGKRALESLIKVGALHGWGERDDLLYALERIVGFSADYHKAQEVGQMSLFGEATGTEEETLQIPEAPAKAKVKRREQLAWEKELLGLYVTGRPVDKHQDIFRNMGNLSLIQDLKDPTTPSPEKVGVAGEVVNIRKILTKNNDSMAVLQFEDWHETAGTIEVVLFPRTYNYVKDFFLREKQRELEEGDIVIISGKYDTSRDAPQIICDNINLEFEVMTPDEAAEHYPKRDLTWVDNSYGYQNGSSQEPPPPAFFDEETGEIAQDEPPPPAPITDVMPATQGASHPTPAIEPQFGAATATALAWMSDSEPVTGENPFADMMDGDKPRAAASHIAVHFPRSAEPDKDRRRLRRIHRVLVGYPGHDTFSIIIDTGKKPVAIKFPNDTTGICDELIKELKSVVGDDNIHIT